MRDNGELFFMKNKMYISYIIHFFLMAGSLILLKLTDENDSNILFIGFLISLFIVLLSTVYIVRLTYKFVKKKKKKA